ncbi:hypothetical protein EDD70_2407 [Hydrogenoanaerobacterium saccharovorans]|uniref:Uncharacterized protein n=1 Tax=Hydrogenoanaerobacterium saccharovorans TaxID=474960 RepID=A0A1H8D1E9_9FIRM|nr:hypothetical protein EDD70_2407 [Hydrogenoanaerobacterium saccharovorans]SEN01281.1 hypothetical protein SAMN05216180_2466 [Hydrogenoanaerobacterium saccharovorans]
MCTLMLACCTFMDFSCKIEISVDNEYEKRIY